MSMSEFVFYYLVSWIILAELGLSILILYSVSCRLYSCSLETQTIQQRSVAHYWHKSCTRNMQLSVPEQYKWSSYVLSQI